MIPIQAGRRTTTTATVTLTLIVLNTVIFFWDRLGAIAGPSRVFADLAMRPVEVVMALQGAGDKFAMATVLTSMFLHGGFAHLLFNMI
ncbi:MAG: rhomboid family intramembrane serine protease, partial [Nitrospirae bacterium]|nr:rhomboid family intramembrane serine protease [Fimbriimonadaceae bacterium]